MKKEEVKTNNEPVVDDRAKKLDDALKLLQEHEQAVTRQWLKERDDIDRKYNRRLKAVLDIEKIQ